MSDQQYLTMAVRVAESRLPNCDGLQCLVSPDLNLANWASYLHKYKDTRLLQFLVYGFPLDVSDNFEYRSHVTNHYSALAFPSQVNKFLNKKELGAIMGPFLEWPVSGCHVSPLMSRPKDGNPNHIGPVKRG